ncbi:MAG: hypothetical protein A2X80_04430 [Geobacteraceae bacterium GWB2_52_12]|nr:MAG: hypothetical protein A2X80_04430 [Geobacteraceae bacterium GWB2_52_12]
MRLMLQSLCCLMVLLFNVSGAVAVDFVTADGTVIVTDAPQHDAGTYSESVPPEDVPADIPENPPVAEQPKEPAWPIHETTRADPPVSSEPVTAGSVDRSGIQGAVSGKGIKNIHSPLQLFRDFTGERTLKNLIRLFDAHLMQQAGVVQIPAIAVSDGSSSVDVRLNSAVFGVAPTFSFRGANLKTLQQLPDGTWELQAIPQKGKCVVYLSIKSGDELVDLPLTVIPPAIASFAQSTGQFSESSVIGLLAAVNRKTDKIFYDMNVDGKQDYLDDYILIGHYLLNRTMIPPQPK